MPRHPQRRTVLLILLFVAAASMGQTSPPPYDRKLFLHWIDHNCRTTRVATGEPRVLVPVRASMGDGEVRQRAAEHAFRAHGAARDAGDVLKRARSATSALGPEFAYFQGIALSLTVRSVTLRLASRSRKAVD